MGPPLYKTPLTRYFESTVYKGGIQNWQFDQDSSGNLFVANSYGLLEFNGTAWKLHNIPNSTKTRAVFIDEDNRIYVGGQGQLGYFKKEQQGWVFHSLLDRLPANNRTINEVWAIFKYQERIHFQTSNGLLAFGQEFQRLMMENRDITGAFLQGQTLLVQDAEGKLDTLNQGSMESAIGTFPPIADVVSSGKGHLVFCLNGEIHTRPKTDTPHLKALSSLFQKTLINDVIRLASGELAIGTQNDGVFVLDRSLNIVQHLTKNQGLEHRTVHSLYEDHFGNLWAGLNNGISYVELSSAFALINEETGLEGTGYSAAIHQGNVYLGTNNGLFTNAPVNEENPERRYQIIPGSEGQVYNFYKSPDMLVMNHHRGAYQVESAGVQSFFSNTGTWKMMPTQLPYLYLGGTYEGLFLFEKGDKDWQVRHQIQGFPESSRVMEWENDSVLWMTHGYKGAFRLVFDREFERASFEHFGEEDGFPSNLLISVYRLNGRLIFTSEQGIYEFDPTTRRFKTNLLLTDLLGNEHVSKIAPFGDGHLLFIANDQLGALYQQSFGEYRRELNLFKKVNRYLSNDLENITVLDAHNILIGAREGFIHFNPNMPEMRPSEFQTHIEGVDLVNGENRESWSSAHFFNDTDLPEGGTIRFHFSTPYFDGLDDLQFSYRLLPFEKNWSEWTALTAKEYTNLPPGDYRFEVKARNVYGEESTKTSTRFKILAPWYKTKTAYAAYLLGGLLVFGFITYSQDRKHQTEKQALKRSKEEAIKEKDQQLSTLSEKSKQEIEDLKNQKLKAEIHHKNNQLASVTMHLINKNEFVQEVRKRIDTVLSQKQVSTEELRKIIKTIDRNMTEDHTWDQFAYHFDQVHGDFLKKLSNSVEKLTPQETKLAAYLRMNMSSKEIANLMNISVRGVELARYRLRKKLGLDRDQNLNDYLMHI